ncbi:DNA polymerase I, thermostable [Synechococcus sp. MIT S9504]|nr:DNA polymerase I, thermostable [Synechococcus sp. MIT S9504]
MFDQQLLFPGSDAIQPADPVPFSGKSPNGIHYIVRPDDLPDPDSMALSIGFDLETFNRRTDLWRHKASLSPSLGGEIRLAQLKTADSSSTLVIDVAVIGQPAVDWLCTLARNPERMLVGHNLLFEATFLIAAGIRPLCQWWDTMLACQIIGDLPSNSLAAASAHYLHRALDKGEQSSDWGNALTASQLRYAALDAEIVLPLGRALHQQLVATQQVAVHRLDCSMISACADGQVRGLAVDMEAALQSRTKALSERERLAAEVQERLGIENYRSPDKLQNALSRHLDEPIDNTKDRTLNSFLPDPVIGQLLQLKALDQELKEVNWLLEEARLTDGRVRPHYRIIGASTGRMSTSALIRETSSHVPSDTERFKTGQRQGEPKAVKLGQCGFNFQGITGDRKKALGTGNPNSVLMDLDWSSIEIRLQASPRLYNDDGQRRILLEGIDPHSYIASQACGREISKADPERSTIGKRANFALAYGCGLSGVRKLLSRARGEQVSEMEAHKVYDAWHRLHPQMSQEMEKFSSETVTEVRSIAGRRMTFRSKQAGPDGTRAMQPLGRTNGINFPVQGSGRDLLAAALGDLWPALDRFPGVHIIGLIHDEILLEVPRDLVEEVKAVALASMTSEKLQNQYLGDIPLQAECNIAESWGEAH